ncbi:MAG: hypothetical protein KGS72_21315 [Cyanobacteria bacterium REEB67]|nr:hypothetical protein [Cyanobacteria bacterium REEB67]
MYNTLLNRYYIANAHRSVAFSETRAKVEELVAKSYLGLNAASGALSSDRGALHHSSRQRELEGLWMRHLVKEEAQKDRSQNLCG